MRYYKVHIFVEYYVYEFVNECWCAGGESRDTATVVRLLRHGQSVAGHGAGPDETAALCTDHEQVCGGSASWGHRPDEPCVQRRPGHLRQRPLLLCLYRLLPGKLGPLTPVLLSKLTIKVFVNLISPFDVNHRFDCHMLHGSRYTTLFIVSYCTWCLLNCTSSMLQPFN